MPQGTTNLGAVIRFPNRSAMRLTPTALVLFLAALLARAAGSTEPAAAAGGGGGRERIPIMPTKVKRKTLEDRWPPTSRLSRSSILALSAERDDTPTWVSE